MNRRTGRKDAGSFDITRRHVLSTGLVVGLGMGAAGLTGALRPADAAAAQPVYGGQATVMNYGYPEVWDPHRAGTLGALGSISPMYNQVVEFNPLKPTEVKRNYIISDKLRTPAGAFVPAETIQTALKWEHVWLQS